MSSASSPTWLITGTSAGLGLALAQFVLAEYHNLISISRYSEPPAALLDLLGALPSEKKPYFYHLSLDLSQQHEDTIKGPISDFLTQHPEIQIDAIVNNAAVASFHPLETFPTNTLNHTFMVNFFSPLWIIQTLLPHMRSQTWQNNGHGKVIMNISSTQGLIADASELAYDASKHALESMSATLAAEITPFNIRVIVVNLGSFRTAFSTSGSRNGLYEVGSDPSVTGDAATTQARAINDRKSTNEIEAYSSPNHPVNKRMMACLRYGNVPGAARGDVQRASRILFSAVMRNPRSAVEQALEQQRKDNLVSADGKGRVERIVLGADGYPGIERQVARLKLEVESCRNLVNMADSDDLL